MKPAQLLALLLTVLPLLAAASTITTDPPQYQNVTLTFDELPASQPLPSLYSHLVWSNSTVTAGAPSSLHPRRHYLLPASPSNYLAAPARLTLANTNDFSGGSQYLGALLRSFSFACVSRLHHRPVPCALAVSGVNCQGAADGDGALLQFSYAPAALRAEKDAPVGAGTRMQFQRVAEMWGEVAGDYCSGYEFGVGGEEEGVKPLLALDDVELGLVYLPE